MSRVWWGGLAATAFAAVNSVHAFADLLDEILEREMRLSRLHVEFEWRAARAPVHADPYDARWWTEAELDKWRREGEIRILRPWFALDSRSHYGRGRHTWVDGKLTQVSREWSQSDDEPWGVYVTGDLFPVHGGEPWLTPLELQSFDTPASYFDLIRAGVLRVAEQSAERVVLSGAQEPGPMQPPWEYRLELDRARGYLPVKYWARLGGARDAHRIEWTMRTMESVPVVGGMHVIRKAIIALRPGVPGERDRWQLYRFTASSIRRDPSIDRDAILPKLPTDNYVLVDRTTGLTRSVDALGRIIHETRETPEEMRRREELFQREVVASVGARETLQKRQTYFIVLTVAALLATAVAVGISFRRRLRAT